MNLHQCLQLALNDCNLSASLSEIGWVSNSEAIQEINKCVMGFGDPAAIKEWGAYLSGAGLSFHNNNGEQE